MHDKTLFSTFAGSACVVTGGLGFMGSNLALALAGAGAHVTVIDSLVPTHGGDHRNIEPLTSDIEVVIADIGQRTAVAKPVADADFIFNLAGQVSHVDSMGDPVRDLDLNAASHLGFLELLRQMNSTAPIVYTSTRQVYGRPSYLPVDEAHPVNPIDVNGICKYAGEQFHLLYSQVHDLTTSALRITNVYGPRQRIRDNRQGFLGIFIRQALEDQPITVYGDGEQLRDCLFVDDVIDAIASAVQSSEIVGKVVNLGHPDPLTLGDIAKTIVQTVGSGSVQFVPWPHDRAQIDIGDYFGDFSLAKRALGWTPKTSFDEGVAATAAYYKGHLDWYL